VHGRDAISKFFASFVASTVVDESSSVTLDVVVAAKTAYETGLYTMTTHQGHAPAIADQGKYLYVWKYDEDSHWRIARAIANSSVARPAGDSSQR